MKAQKYIFLKMKPCYHTRHRCWDCLDQIQTHLPNIFNCIVYWLPSQIFMLKRTTLCPNITLNVQELLRVQKNDTHNLPGLYLNKKLTWKIYFNAKLNEAPLRHIFPIMNRKSCLKIKCSLLFYKSISRPLLTYGSELWRVGHSSKTNRIQIFQKSAETSSKCSMVFQNNHLHRDLVI